MISIRLPVLFCILILVPTAFLKSQEEDPFTPAKHAIGRYEHIWKRSPFVVETKLIEESAGLAQRFALTGVAVVDGDPVAFLLDRGSLSRMIVGKGNSPQGLELVSVDQQTNAKNSSAVIRLGSEQASLRFENTSLTAAAEGVPMPMPPQPGNGNPPPNANITSSPSNPPANPARVIRRTLIRPRE